MLLFARPRTALAFLLLSAISSGFAQHDGAAIKSTAPSTLSQAGINPAHPTLFLVGDTVMGTSAEQRSADVRALFSFFNPRLINLVDRTIDHRTSRTYLREGDWQQTRALIRTGDIVLFQFAETDPDLTAGTAPVPGTLPGIGDEIREVRESARRQPEIVHTYGWYLRLYVVETIARGAVPILCSAPPRTHDPGALPTAPDVYADWVRQIAAQQRVAFLDLDAASRAPRPASTDAAQTQAHPVANGPYAPAVSPTSAATTSSRTASAALAPASAPTDSTPIAASGLDATTDAELIVAALKGLPNDPLAGYFSADSGSVPAFTPAAAPRAISRDSQDMPTPPGSSGQTDSY